MLHFEAQSTLRQICDRVCLDERRVLQSATDDTARLGEALCDVLKARRERDEVTAMVGAVLATLTEWHKHKPDVALRVLVDVACGEALCNGVASVANAALERRVRVDEHAPNAARALVRCLGESDGLCASALQALTTLGRAAPLALVPVWHAVLPPVLLAVHGGTVDERIAAADCVVALLVGGTKLSTKKRTSSSHAFTSTAEYVHRYCVDVAMSVEHGIGTENDRGVLAKLVKIAMHVGTLAIPGERCERIVCALLERVQNDSGNVVGVAAMKAIANVLNSRKEGVSNEVVERTVDCAMGCISRHGAMGVEESLLVLQAVCTYNVMVVWKKWAALQLLLVTLAEGEHDVIALHAVRVCVKLLQAFSELEELEQSDMVNQLVDVYQAVAFRAHRHSFHAIRSAAVLAAEILLRISGTESGRITVSARDALLLAAMNDVSGPVRCAAVRALCAVNIEKCDCETTERIISQLFAILVQPDSSMMLQARCAWSLASIVDKAFHSVRRFESRLSECVRNCEAHAVQKLNNRQQALLHDTGNRVRASDNDTCATGLVRLIAATLRYGISNNWAVNFESVQCLCEVVRCRKEAPKTRWNACTALGDVLHARHDKQAVETLYDVCNTANTVKIRTAAARALRRSACTLGVAACVRLFEGARRISAAPHDVVEACAIATAALVHDCLANGSHNRAAVIANPQVLVDAIAVHTQLPSYVLNPRAKLPPTSNDNDSPQAAIAALPSISIRALYTVAAVAELNPQFNALAQHLRTALEGKDLRIVDTFGGVKE